MKRMSWIVCLLAGAALFAQASPIMGPQKGGGVEQAVLKLEQEWVDALLKADAVKLALLCADTLVYTHSSGAVDDKAKYLASIKSGATKYLAFDRDDIKVNVYGDAAVVTCHVLIKLKANGEDRTVNGRMIRVYARQKGRWQMVAHQTTKLG